MAAQYTVNFSVEGADELDIASERLTGETGSTVYVLLNEESNNRLYDYYASVKTLILKGNRVILFLSEDRSKIGTQIAMLLVSYRQYDIYRIEKESLLTSEYLREVADRCPTYEEVETFISSDIATYDKLNEVLSKLSDLAQGNKLEELTSEIMSNITVLESTINVVDI